MLKKFNQFILENLNEQEYIIKDYFYDLIDDGVKYTYNFLYDDMFYITLSRDINIFQPSPGDRRLDDNKTDIKNIKSIIDQYNSAEDAKIKYWEPEIDYVVYLFSQSLIDKLKPIFSNLIIKKKFLDKNIYFYKQIENTENKNRNKRFFSKNTSKEYSNLITQSDSDGYLYLDQSIWNKINKLLPYHTAPYISAAIADQMIKCVMYDIYKIKCSTPSIFSQCKNKKILLQHALTKPRNYHRNIINENKNENLEDIYKDYFYDIIDDDINYEYFKINDNDFAIKIGKCDENIVEGIIGKINAIEDNKVEYCKLYNNFYIFNTDFINKHKQIMDIYNTSIGTGGTKYFLRHGTTVMSIDTNNILSVYHKEIWRKLQHALKHNYLDAGLLIILIKNLYKINIEGIL